MENNLAKNYDPKQFEDRIYKEWEAAGAFRPEVNPEGITQRLMQDFPTSTRRAHLIG